jgi:EAL domain-containing protein (putative c-di-GMP-specific phosphodiesterase class I)
MTHYTLDVVESALISDSPLRTRGDFAGMRLTSHFQPVFSLAHKRAVGHEALLRATDAEGKQISPLRAFHAADLVGQTVLLDRISRAVHLRNFLAQPAADSSWLFLNFNPMALGDARHRHGKFFDDLLKSAAFPAHRIVVEVLESSLLEIVGLEDSVAGLRALGCLIAIDDFGAGHSNFDRIWRLKPDIVKLDRSMVQQAYRDPVARSLIPRITSILHESGALVLMEGVESESQAMIAMDADVDFVQGYYFAAPGPDLATMPNGGASFDSLFDVHRRLALLELRDYQQGVSPYVCILDLAAQNVKSGAPLAEALREFLDLPMAERCYLLDSRGHQIGPGLLATRALAQADPRYAPIADAPGANLGRRHYFRQAMAQPGSAHVTRPYLSVATATLCVTVSVAIEIGGDWHVLCGDIKWNEKPAAGDRSIDSMLHVRPR